MAQNTRERGTFGEEEVPDVENALTKKRVKKWRAYDEFLLKPYNAFFAENLELGLRGATFIVIFAIPFLMHSRWDTPIGAFRDLAIFKTGAAVFIIFNFARTVGETISLCKGAFLGVFLAVLLTWILNGFMPGGHKDGMDGSVWWTIVIAGLVFNVIVANINLSVNCKVFSCMSFSFHWMNLLSPKGHSDKNYAQNFQLDLGSYGACELMAVAVGCLLAILATLLPEPLWAMDKAKDSALDLTDAMGDVWNDILDFFCADVPDIVEQEKFMADMAILHHEVTKLEVHISHAWFECFGMGKWQQERLMLNRLNTALHMTYDRLTSVWNAVVQEEFGAYHTKMMDALTPHARSVCELSHELFATCTDEVCKYGHIRDEKIREVELMITRCRSSMRTFMKEFRMVKASLRLTPVTEELLDEHAFCISVSGAGRNAIEFAEDILQHQKGQKQLKQCDQHIAIFDAKVIFEADHAIRAFRRMLAFLLAFCIGYYGYNGLIREYNSTLAATVAILFSNHLGSAAAENVNKLQGIILGTVIGQVSYSVLGWCDWYYILILGVFLWLYSFMTLFLYYKSAHYGNICLYMAVFGCNDFLLGCSDSFDKSSSYHVLVDAVAAMFLIVCVDMVFENRRASDMAKDAIVDVWKLLNAGTADLFDSDSTGIREHKGTILAKVQRADLLGMEAEWESRFWRTPWKAELYRMAIQCFYRLRMSLSGLEYELSTESGDGGGKDATFVDLLKLETFQVVKTNLTDKMTQLEKLFAIFVHEVQGPMPLLQDAANLLDDNLFGEMAAMQALIKDVNQRGLGNDAGADILNDDPASEISLIIATMSAMTGEMRGLQKEILKA